MTDQERWTAVDHYISDRLIPPDPALRATLEANATHGLPAIDVAANQGKFLYLLAQMINARRILEIGTLGGYSTIWLGRALPARGCLVTLELDPKHAEVATENIANAGLGEAVEVRVGPATESLAQLVQEKAEPFDLIFIDADKQGYPAYLTWALRLARKGTVILLDNVVRDGEVLNAESTDDRVQAVRRMFEMIAAEPRLSATALQTVGSKGYDGFAMAVVISD